MAAATLWTARIMVLLLAAACVAPLVSTGHWTVRLFDFPRLQVAVAALVVLAVVVTAGAVGGWNRWMSLLTLITVAALVWQSSHVLPYTPLWPRETPQASDGASLRVIVVNLMEENDEKEAAAAMLGSLEADVLLLIEIDDDWRGELDEIAAALPHRCEAIRDGGLGIALWSRLPLHDAEVRHLVSEDRPSIIATIGEGPGIRIIGVHPPPPGLDQRGVGRHGSRERDAELMLIALEVAARPGDAWIVAGDFNDVAWSRTTRLFQRLSGLRDPRVGRGLLNTYHAQYPLLRYPIDHVFLSDGFAVASLDRHLTPGSDHFAIAADVVLEAPIGVTPDPVGDDQQDASEIIEEGLDS